MFDQLLSLSERQVVNNADAVVRCRLRFGSSGFGAFDVTERNLQRQISSRIPGDPSAVRIEARLIEIVAVFIRFAPGENAAFDFYPADRFQTKPAVATPKVTCVESCQ